MNLLRILFPTYDITYENLRRKLNALKISFLKVFMRSTRIMDFNNY